MATKQTTKGPRVRNITPMERRLQTRRQQGSDPLQLELFKLIRVLQLTMAVVSAAVGALKAQAAERDEDIALLLQRHVGDALGKEVEKWEHMLQVLKKEQPLASR